MEFKKLLLIYLCFASYNVHPEETPEFYPPNLSPEEAFRFAGRHLEKEEINLIKYKLTSLEYSYGPRKWITQYILSSDNNEPSNNTINIYINDEYPCDYEIIRR